MLVFFVPVLSVSRLSLAGAVASASRRLRMRFVSDETIGFGPAKMLDLDATLLSGVMLEVSDAATALTNNSESKQTAIIFEQQFRLFVGARMREGRMLCARFWKELPIERKQTDKEKKTNERSLPVNVDGQCPNVSNASVTLWPRKILSA